MDVFFQETAIVFADSSLVAGMQPFGARAHLVLSPLGIAHLERFEVDSASLRFVDRIQENCEPALSTVLFMAGAGGSLRAGVTENPVRLTQSVKQALTRVTAGGAPCYVWPGGGITYMVDVTALPENAFGSVPTPALVAPIEFTMRKAEYEALGGHMDEVRSLSDITRSGAKKYIAV